MDYGAKWIEELPKVVWGLRTQISRATGYSPFFLVYGSEAVLPADLIWMSPRLELDSTEEVRVNATLQSARYLQGLRCHYNKNTQPRSLQIEDLVLRRIQKTDRRHKLLSPWEGPFIVSKVMGRSFYCLKSHWTRHVQVNN